MRFVIATRHFAGLGFALRLQDEGHDVVMAFAGTDDRRLEDRYALVGNGMIPKRPLADVMRDRAEWRDACWVWDENHSVDENELLRQEQFKVLGGGRYADTMEHDREACLTLVGAHGLVPPPSFAFSDSSTALAFLEQHPDTAYVYKPDVGETYETWLPQRESAADANLELRQHLRTRTSAAAFVLQERKDGIETNVEVWFIAGEPVFAFMVLESKRKLTGDLGDFSGVPSTSPSSSHSRVERCRRVWAACSPSTAPCAIPGLATPTSSWRATASGSSRSVSGSATMRIPTCSGT